MSRKMCELCGENPATVPDRARMYGADGTTLADAKLIDPAGEK